MPLASARQIAGTAGGSVNTAAVCCQTVGGGGWPGDSDEGVIMEVRASSGWVGGGVEQGAHLLHSACFSSCFLQLLWAEGRQKRVGGEDEEEPRG